MPLTNRSHMTYYWFSIVTTALSCTIFEWFIIK